MTFNELFTSDLIFSWWGEGAEANCLNFRLPLNGRVTATFQVQAKQHDFVISVAKHAKLVGLLAEAPWGTSKMTKAIHKSSETVFGGFVSLLRKQLKRNEELDSVSPFYPFYPCHSQKECVPPRLCFQGVHGTAESCPFHSSLLHLWYNGQVGGQGNLGNL